MLNLCHSLIRTCVCGGLPLAVALVGPMANSEAIAQQPQVTAEQLLRQYSPTQKNVEFDQPSDADVAR